MDKLAEFLAHAYRDIKSLALGACASVALYASLSGPTPVLQEPVRTRPIPPVATVSAKDRDTELIGRILPALVVALAASSGPAASAQSVAILAPAGTYQVYVPAPVVVEQGDGWIKFSWKSVPTPTPAPVPPTPTPNPTPVPPTPTPTPTPVPPRPPWLPPGPPSPPAPTPVTKRVQQDRSQVPPVVWTASLIKGR